MNDLEKQALEYAGTYGEEQLAFMAGAKWQAKEDIDALKNQAESIWKLLSALKEINREELNSQRPGGGYSKIAQISYKILKEFGDEEI